MGAMKKFILIKMLFDSKNIFTSYIRPSSTFFKISKFMLLSSIDKTTHIYVLEDYIEDVSSGVIVYDNGVLNIFNFKRNSVIKISNIHKLLLKIKYIFEAKDRFATEFSFGYIINVIYIDDGCINDLEIKVLSSKNPDFAYGISFNVYKNISIKNDVCLVKEANIPIDIRSVDTISIFKEYFGNMKETITKNSIITNLKMRKIYAYLS